MKGEHKSIAGWQAADFLAAYNLPPASKGTTVMERKRRLQRSGQTGVAERSELSAAP